MPPKRRRTSESSSSNDDGKRTGPQPHDKLWFDDGNIVLATEVHLYRVYKGMLVKHSMVLNNMFEIPTGDANTERWEDVPMVQMVGDKDEEVSALLEALYDRHFQDTVCGLELPTLSSLLSISTKYDFNEIRADVMKRLVTLFPNELEQVEEAKILWKRHLVKYVCELVVVAHRCEALLILPAMYYRLSGCPLEVAFRYLQDLPEDRLTSFLLGREWLRDISHDLKRISLRPKQTAKICRHPECLERFLALLPDQPFQIIFDLYNGGLMAGLDVHSGICKVCEQEHIQIVKWTKEAAWEILPEQFLDKSWEELRQT
ncbi:hypothetical protein SCHPADRAFT_1001827 [Schizopora paradoxa]|uniref:BTB domain-containing protein n=1 Tax=Schizopora paradoxa TaxID=27342 RepID=A0A0H2RCI2_9AGAM|nr:hypothetical protein SCHPADRAFT_1001827 [Schizopora paradoxa]